MFPYIIYEPIYFEVERLLNDPSLSKQNRNPGFSRDEVQFNFQNGKLTVAESAETKKFEDHAETGPKNLAWTCTKENRDPDLG